MIVLRDQQIDAIFALMRDGYAPKIAEHLRAAAKVPAAAALDRAALEEQVRRSMERAAAHGIDVEWDFCRFAHLDLLHGPGFDERCDWAARILGKEGISGTEKADLLESYHRNYLAAGAGGA